MDHWAYRTDDDEIPEKESTHAAESKLHQLQQAQMSADDSSGGSTTPCVATNAPGDRSWWALTPDPQKAQPLPRDYQHKQPAGCAPQIEDGEIVPAEDDGEYQDPRLPPGVIDITDELYWEHRRKRQLREWARAFVARCATVSADTENGNACSSETPARDTTREETTRNRSVEALGPPFRREGEIRRPRDRMWPWNAPRPQRLPCLEHPSDGLAGPLRGSTRHRGRVGPYHTSERRESNQTPYSGRSYARTVDHRSQFRSGSTSAAWNSSRQNPAYERRRDRHTSHWE